MKAILILLTIFRVFIGAELVVAEPDPPQKEIVVVVEETAASIKEEPTVEVKEIVEEREEAIILYDVPLDADLQKHIIAECGKHDIEPAIVFAMIRKESNFDIDLMGDNGNSYGLMQVQLKWHKGRMEKLGCSDLLNPYDNTTVGIDYFAEMLARGNGLEWALMAYNGGASYANKQVKNGNVSKYVVKVLEYSKEIKEAQNG